KNNVQATPWKLWGLGQLGRGTDRNLSFKSLVISTNRTAGLAGLHAAVASDREVSVPPPRHPLTHQRTLYVGHLPTINAMNVVLLSYLPRLTRGKCNSSQSLL